MSNIKGVKCVAPIFDSSGYAEWSRSYIVNLIKSGIPVTIVPASFEGARPDLGPVGELLNQHINKNIEYNAVICWLIPPAAVQIFKQEPADKVKILFTLWETDSLYKPWALFVNTYADECWVPGEFNKKIFQDSGIEVPIRTFNYAMDSSEYKTDIKIDLRNQGCVIPDSTYVFYFVSQWTERKNFKDLIEAYWSAFKPTDDVCLVLKTHIQNYSEEEAKHIHGAIAGLAKSANYTSTPNVVLLTKLIPREYMFGLHKRCNCYVSPSRGEGLGLGILEAGMLGNPVIVNAYGEHMSYIDSLTGFIYNHTMRPVSGMAGNYYNGSQNWAQPDVSALAKEMRFCFDNQQVARDKGQALKKSLIKQCDPLKVQKELLEALESAITAKG